MMEWRAESPEKMEQLGFQSARQARAGMIIALVGGLGCWKDPLDQRFRGGIGVIRRGDQPHLRSCS